MTNVSVVDMARAAPTPKKSENVQTPKGDDDFKKYLEACSKEDDQKKSDELPDDEAAKKAAIDAAMMLLQPVPVKVETVQAEAQVVESKPAEPTPSLAVQAEAPVQIDAEEADETAAKMLDSTKAVKAETRPEQSAFVQTMKAVESEKPVEAQAPVAPKVEALPVEPAKVETPKAAVVVEEKPVVKAAPKAAVEETPIVTTNEVVSTKAVVDLGTGKVETRPFELVRQMSSEITSMVTTGKNSLHIQIQPENMGRIDVRLISNSDGMRVVMTTDSSATGKMLENNLNQLQRSLSEAGLQISGLSVNSQGLQGQFSKNFLEQAPVMPNFYAKHAATTVLPVDAIAARYSGQLSGLDFRV
jgi:flagellar hook-length control protein FliK